MKFLEPKWKSYIVTTTVPLFTPEQCRDIINIGRSLPKETAKVGLTTNQNTYSNDGGVDLKKRTSNISWIPFEKAMPMYKVIENFILKTNNNHFGFDGITIGEYAQYTEYSEGGFYDWHMDNEIMGNNEPPVRKISMTLALNSENEYEGGGLEMMESGNILKPPIGHAIFFASFIRHRAVPVTKGNRKSLVMWFGGPSFK